jgi:hypothetical protein
MLAIVIPIMTSMSEKPARWDRRSASRPDGAGRKEAEAEDPRVMKTAKKVMKGGGT